MTEALAAAHSLVKDTANLTLNVAAIVTVATATVGMANIAYETTCEIVDTRRSRKARKNQA